MSTLKYLLIFPMLWYSCASTVNVLKPEGDSATLSLADGRTPFVELIAISDSALIVNHNSILKQVRLDNIAGIYVHGYRIESGAKALGAVPIVIVEGILMAVAFDIGQPGWGIVSGLTMVASVVVFATSEPKSKFAAPFDSDDLDKLRLYCRYPQGLSEEQKKELLRHFNQDEILFFHLTFSPERPLN